MRRAVLSVLAVALAAGACAVEDLQDGRRQQSGPAIGAEPELSVGEGDAIGPFGDEGAVVVYGEDPFGVGVGARLTRVQPVGVGTDAVLSSAASHGAAGPAGEVIGEESAFDPFTAPTESDIDLERLAIAVATIDEDSDCDVVAPLSLAAVRMVDAGADISDVDASPDVVEVVRIAGGCLLVEYAALDGRTVDQVRALLAADESVHAVGFAPRGLRSTHEGAHGAHMGDHAADDISGSNGMKLWHLPLPDFADLWDEWDASRPVTVAVLDSGVEVTHPDLRNQIVGETLGGCHDSDYLAKHHGTSVAGVVAAERGNGGSIGVAPQARILPIRVLRRDECKHEVKITEAVAQAVNRGANIVNMSLTWRSDFRDTNVRYVGGVPVDLGGLNSLNDNRGVTDDTFELAVRAASMLGIVLVASAGNCGNAAKLDKCDEHNQYQAPARYRDVIAVANIEKEGRLADNSTRNDYVEIAAPGTKIFAPVPSPKGSYNATVAARDALYEERNGTSFAAPFVAGVVAHMLNRHPLATTGQVRKALRETANRSRIKPSAPQQVPDPKFGFGIVEPTAAVERLGEILEGLEPSGPEGDFEEVSAGERHTCGLRRSGLVRCWGARAVRDVPDLAFSSLSSPPQRDFVCGVRKAVSASDAGAVACWGDLPDGLRAVAAPTGDGGAGSVLRFAQVSAGSGHVCALRSDGAVVCWGDNAAVQAPRAGLAGLRVLAGGEDLLAGEFERDATSTRRSRRAAMCGW